MYITPEDYATAERNGIDKVRLEYRVRIAGWSVARAIKTPLRNYKRHGDWLNVARQSGLPDTTFHNRICNGWTAEKAATTPILSPSEKGSLGGRSKRTNKIRR